MLLVFKHADADALVCVTSACSCRAARSHIMPLSLAALGNHAKQQKPILYFFVFIHQCVSAFREHHLSGTIAAGQFFCSGVCQRVSCATAARAGQLYPPTLNFLTVTTDLLGSKTLIYVEYGTQLPLNLLPCSSNGKTADPMQCKPSPDASSNGASRSCMCLACSIDRLRCCKVKPDFLWHSICRCVCNTQGHQDAILCHKVHVYNQVHTYDVASGSRKAETTAEQHQHNFAKVYPKSCNEAQWSH